MLSSIWKHVYFSYLRLVKSRHIPHEEIAADEIYGFRARVEVNEPKKILSRSYHKTNPELAICKGYKQIVEIIYNSFDKDGKVKHYKLCHYQILFQSNNIRIILYT